MAVLVAPLVLVGSLTGCSLVTSPGLEAQVNDDGGVVDPVAARFPPLADAAIKSCSGSAGTWTISGAVRNPTSWPFLYTLVVDLVDKTGAVTDQVDAGPGTSVKPGTVGSWTVTDTGAATTTVACRVGSVTRYTP